MCGRFIQEPGNEHQGTSMRLKQEVVSESRMPLVQLFQITGVSILYACFLLHLEFNPKEWTFENA